MRIIAHRGLTDGPDQDGLAENTANQISYALSLGFDVEIDLWEIHDRWYLGHDGPHEEVSWDFINDSRFWIHCKTTQTFLSMRAKTQLLRYFYHDKDLIVLTSHGDIWTYFGDPRTASRHSICVMPEATRSWGEISADITAGIWGGYCTDWPKKIAECLK